MSRWGKNIVVPLDSLCKEKENTNRPTVARSVGTVGKWGKMGFTSTRTYSLSALPAAVAAAAAAAVAAASPAQSPASALDDDLSPSVPEPPKPKKFFKSRNSAPPEVIAQIIQQMPRASTSPIRDNAGGATPGYLSTPVHGREPIKLKIPKSNSAERKKRSPKKTIKSAKAAAAATSSATDEGGKDVSAAAVATATAAPSTQTDSKSKKKKEEKKLKPEAAPSRVISRARKTVNYCEDDEDERTATPLKDLIMMRDPPPETTITASAHQSELEATVVVPPAEAESATSSSTLAEPALPPPAAPHMSSSAGAVVVTAPVVAAAAAATVIAPKTPEHPPIVLRISKGTSRLVSTDSEEQPTTSPPQYDAATGATESTKSRHASTEEESAATVDTTSQTVPLPPPTTPTTNTPRIIVKPPKPPPASPEQLPPPAVAPLAEEETPEINYCTVKISPDKPPKERLKLIIKTDVIRNAIAAAAAAAAAKAAAAAEKAAAAAESGVASNSLPPPPEKERKQKSRKHKQPKHAAVEQLTPAAASAAAVSEFKTPSPHLALSAEHPRTVISPPALSERDFDSQSSVLGSISSKGNSTPQPLAQTVLDESCVIHSRGSSVITSDLETSQHSSLVAPPSDIESRLESMMMGEGGGSGAAPNLLQEEEPLQEDDILAVLRGGDESQMAPLELNVKLNGNVPLEANVEKGAKAEKLVENVAADATASTLSSPTKRRATRGRGRGATKAIYAEDDEDDEEELPLASFKTTPTTTATGRTRGRKPVSGALNVPPVETLTPSTKRATRRGGKKTTEPADTIAMEVDEAPTTVVSTIKTGSSNKSEEENTPTLSTPAAMVPTAPTAARRGRPPRNAATAATASSNNNNLSSSNNNNINKIAANLSAKAGAAEAEAKDAAVNNHLGNHNTSPTPAPNATTTQQPRSYGRKRKNQQVTQVLQPPATGAAEELSAEMQPTPAKMANIDLPPAPAVSATIGNENATTITPPPQLNSLLSQTPTPSLELLHDSGTADDIDDDANSNNSRPHSTTPASPPRRDYRFKDKFKRTLMLDNQVNCNAVLASGEANSGANPAADGEQDDAQQQRGAVKLVISKKKGSIFKSRALVHDATAEQSSTAAASKRHLYKHRWDAEANGAGSGDGNTGASSVATTNAGAAGEGAQSNAPPTLRTAADAILDDFSEDLSAGAHSRDHSPAIGLLTRVVKPNPAGASNPFDMDDGVDATGGPTSSGTGGGDTITSVRIDRKAKEYYTVVRNVKTAHQIQEIGEYQEMDDDVEYILDALQPHNPTATRCLSALQLATKCMTPAFRMHVRAHGVVTKFFKALSDANTDLSLGLCTSAIMYILSQEGLNMDLDRDSLELMMNLLEAEGVAAPSDRANYDRNKQKVRELCEEIKALGKATHLNVDSITVGTLAMETLLSLTSKRAGEWFKEELRELGGLEHIIKTISDCCRPVIESVGSNNDTSIKWTQSLLDNLQTVERCMRVLENVTQMNEENQKYMLTYAQGTAINTLCTLYRLCDRELTTLQPAAANSAAEYYGTKQNPANVLRELLIPVMKVLINLTHTFNPTNALGAETLGTRVDVLETSFHLLLQGPNYIPDRCVFELSMLVLLLLINLTMHAESNRALIMKAYAPSEFVSQHLALSAPPRKVSAVQAVMEYFYKCEELARLVEKNTDAILDNTDKNKKKQEEVDETVNNLLQGAGHHMEHSLKGSYAGILIGHLITDNETHEAIVRTHLRDNGFKEIVSVLEKYYTFMNLTASSEAAAVAHIKSTKKLIDYFKKRDLVYEMNASNDDCALPLNLEKHHAAAAGTPTDASLQATTTRSTPRVFKTYSQR